MGGGSTVDGSSTDFDLGLHRLAAAAVPGTSLCMRRGARFIPTRSIPTSVIPTRAIPTPRPEPSIKRVWPTSPLARFSYAVL